MKTNRNNKRHFEWNKNKGCTFNKAFHSLRDKPSSDQRFATQLLATRNSNSLRRDGQFTLLHRAAMAGGLPSNSERSGTAESRISITSILLKSNLTFAISFIFILVESRLELLCFAILHYFCIVVIRWSLVCLDPASWIHCILS